jgi:hypothetical protein
VFRNLHWQECRGISGVVIVAEAWQAIFTEWNVSKWDFHLMGFFTKWDFTKWVFTFWEFYLMGFLPNGIFA